MRFQVSVPAEVFARMDKQEAAGWRLRIYAVADRVALREVHDLRDGLITFVGNDPSGDPLVAGLVTDLERLASGVTPWGTSSGPGTGALL